MRHDHPIANRPQDGKALRALAEEYCKAAALLCDEGPRGKSICWAPFRLCAIHAIELHLSAFLLDAGYEWSSIKKMNHHLDQRAMLATEHGLNLRKRSSDLLAKLSSEASYSVTRYVPERLADGRHPSQIMAVLKEISSKCALQPESSLMP